MLKTLVQISQILTKCIAKICSAFLKKKEYHIQWKLLIMIILGPAIFDKNNWLITLSGGYKYVHYLTQFIVTTFYMYKKQQNLFK